MNEQIKPRCYHIADKKYVKLTGIGFETDEVIIFQEETFVDNGGNKIAPMTDVILERSVGLTDKNGNEIYEGDIISVCNGSINGYPWMNDPYLVEYQINKGFTIPMFLWNKEGCDLSDSTHWCEVIGNIHDNIDLLKK